MTWAEATQIMLTGVAAAGSLVSVAALFSFGRRIERSLADFDRGEFEEGIGTALESTQRWNDNYDRGDDRSD